jgi:hypothetical protein
MFAAGGHGSPLCRKGANLVGPDQAAASLDIESKNRDQPELYIYCFRTCPNARRQPISGLRSKEL